MTFQHRAIENMKKYIGFYTHNIHKAIKRQEIDVIAEIMRDYATMFKSFLEGHMPNDRIVDVKTSVGGDVDVKTERSHSMRVRMAYAQHAYEEMWHEIDAAHLKEKVVEMMKR